MRNTKHAEEPAVPAEQPMECRIGRDDTHGKVVMAYTRKIDNISFAPGAAVDTAKALLEVAKQLDPASVQGIAW
jgi:hypothetical protein